MEAVNLCGITRWGKVQAWWLRHPGVEADHFCLLAALATYADERGVCEPSQATLARWLKRSRPWVNRVIADLVDVGLLEKAARIRANGGTTSCRYRLVSVPPTADGDVNPLTPPVTDDDSPCQPTDTNQHDLEQNQGLAPSTRAANSSASSTREGSADPHPISASTPEPSGALAVDWHPSDAAVARASSLLPAADIEEHTALFVARCRAKGYAIRRGGEDDLWLAWLIEDQRQSSRACHRTPATAHKSRPAPHRRVQEARYERFAAWGFAAARSDTTTIEGRTECV